MTTRQHGGTGNSEERALRVQRGLAHLGLGRDQHRALLERTVGERLTIYVRPVDVAC